MNQNNHTFENMPESADELLAMAVTRDISSRLEQAMFDDAVIAEYLTTASATVEFDVVIDRALGQGSLEGSLEFRGERQDDQPFAGNLGQPMVAAMVAAIRQRVGRGVAERLPARDESFCFEIAIAPHPVMPLGA